jgi:hypothetical protein
MNSWMQWAISFSGEFQEDRFDEIWAKRHIAYNDKDPKRIINQHLNTSAQEDYMTVALGMTDQMEVV